MTPASLVVGIDDPSGVAEARRQAAALARRLDFGSTVAGQLAIAVTELASNISKHAQRGRIVLRVRQVKDTAGIEVIAMDHGPGIANIAESLRDGHSTAGTRGTGLGALQRLTAGFELYTQAGKGVIARFEAWPSVTPEAAPGGLPHGVVCAPMPGEAVCGDAWAMLSSRGKHVLFVVDGLGHGPEAALAAAAAIDAAGKGIQLTATDFIASVHDALRPTRGAAAAVAMLDPERELCIYCGIGNIAAAIRFNGASRNMVSHNGILGHQVRKIQEFSYPFPGGALCIAHSDGLSARWDLGAYPGLEQRHPALIAAALYRDYRRERDDATVVVVRNERAVR